MWKLEHPKNFVHSVKAPAPFSHWHRQDSCGPFWFLVSAFFPCRHSLNSWCFSLIEQQLSSVRMTQKNIYSLGIQRHSHCNTCHETRTRGERGFISKQETQAAAFCQGVNCFIKMIILHSDKLTVGGNKVYSFIYKFIHVSKAKNSLSAACSFFSI